MILRARIGPLSRNGREFVDEQEHDREPRGTTRLDRWRHAILSWAIVLQWLSAAILSITIVAVAIAIVFGYETQGVLLILGVNMPVLVLARATSWAIKRNWWWAQ